MNAPSIPSPAISFVGRKNSGKTTLLEKLITNLADKGLRIATVTPTLTLIFLAAILIVIAQRVPKVPRFFPMYVLRK